MIPHRCCHYSVQIHVLQHRAFCQNQFPLDSPWVFLQIPAWYTAYSQLLFVLMSLGPSALLSSLRTPCPLFLQWPQTFSLPDSVSALPAGRKTFRFRNLSLLLSGFLTVHTFFWKTYGKSEEGFLHRLRSYLPHLYLLCALNSLQSSMHFLRSHVSWYLWYSRQNRFRSYHVQISDHINPVLWRYSHLPVFSYVILSAFLCFVYAVSFLITRIHLFFLRVNSFFLYIIW